MMRFFLFLLFIAAVIGGAWFWEQQNYAAPGPSEKYTVVMVEPGDHVAVIAQHLANAGVVANADLFRLGLRIRNLQGTLKAGEYGFPAHVSMADVQGILASGKSVQHKLTAAEGLTSQMIFDIVKNDPVLTGDAGAVPDEGTLLPETYLFTRGTTRVKIIAEMRKAQREVLAKLWPTRADGLPIRSKEQAVTLASIVEKETALPEERRHVAAVFMNRLRMGMKLQSDPTIIYDITKGYPLGRGIRESELMRASPHNTYAIPGLPPTPICNPGKDSIAAVLNPATSSDLYFVANGKGGHVFSATVSDQNRNVANWRQIEKQQKAQQTLPAPSLRH
ncbi:MAG TPA: endolytic transglycosylase MltG [Rhizomicrobium sp.]|nr:endolytic transglycosylase MltG [Rhizomicrobium sp.]